MRLVSNFSDYYDHAFDLDGPVFRRMTNEGPKKSKQFEILQGLGLKVPPHGPAHSVLDHWWEDEETWINWAVLYEDESAHCGEGKRKVNKARLSWNGNISQIPESMQLYETFCSAYVGNGYNSFPSKSWRLLQIGKYAFWIEYVSFTDWRSNCGEGTCELFFVEENDQFAKQLGLPLFAIDFVQGKNFNFAVDFNVAPGIRGTGVEQYLSPRQVVEEIIDYSK